MKNEILEKLKKTNFNPIAIANVPDGTIILEQGLEDNQYMRLQVLGTAVVSKIVDLDKKPYTGAEIIEAYPDEYESITPDNDDFFIHYGNAVVLSIFEKDDFDVRHILRKAYINDEIVELDLF